MKFILTSTAGIKYDCIPAKEETITYKVKRSKRNPYNGVGGGPWYSTEIVEKQEQKNMVEVNTLEELLDMLKAVDKEYQEKHNGYCIDGIIVATYRFAMNDYYELEIYDGYRE